MDIDEHAHRRKMNSFRYNKLAAIFTKALDQSWERLRLIRTLDKAHMEGEFSNHTIKMILEYYEEDE